jgi:glycosyltransferase involved in cell wall biosynthesis
VTRTKPIRVLHTLGNLRPSGAERMLACSRSEWSRVGIEPIVVGMADGEHPYAAVLEAAGYDVRLLPSNRTMRGLLALRRLLRELQPAVIHLHEEQMFHYVSVLAASVRPRPAVVRSIHAMFEYPPDVTRRRRRRNRIADALGVVAVPCSLEVALHERRRYRTSVAATVENWVDTATMGGVSVVEGRALRATIAVPADSLIVALVGNCAPGKGHELLLDALAHVRRPVVVLHAGHESGAHSAEREAWARVSPPHQLRRLGPVADVAQLIASADLVAIPSVREGFALVAAEALCVGTPVVAAHSAGLQWLSEFATAMLIPRDAQLWAAALTRAPSHRCVDHLADREWALRRFSPRRGVEDWLAVYGSALGSDERLR